jgi:alcohol dehydrogenase class IV
VVNNPTEANRTLMLEGSYLAGKAINISRTTAPHAVSYRLAQVYKIPHGHAVAMTLPTFFEYNLEATEANAAKTAKELCNLLGCSTIQEGKAKLEHLMDEAGLKRRFTALGATNRADLDDLVASVNQQRLSNNPRPVDAGTLHRLLEALW